MKILVMGAAMALSVVLFTGCKKEEAPLPLKSATHSVMETGGEEPPVPPPPHKP